MANDLLQTSFDAFAEGFTEKLDTSKTYNVEELLFLAHRAFFIGAFSALHYLGDSERDARETWATLHGELMRFQTEVESNATEAEQC